MLKISKLTDYGLVLLTELKEDEVLSASFLSKKTQIPLATTNKILKKLLAKNICSSKYGKTGGFFLSKPHNNISLLEVINCIEDNPTHFTECSNINNQCQLKNNCKISSKMKLIDKEIHSILNQKFISDLI